MPKFPAYLITGEIPKTTLADLNSAAFGGEVNTIGRATLILESRIRGAMKLARIDVDRVNLQSSPDAIGVVTISIPNGDKDANLNKFRAWLESRGSLTTTNHINAGGKSRFFVKFRNDDDATPDDAESPDDENNEEPETGL